RFTDVCVTGRRSLSVSCARIAMRTDDRAFLSKLVVASWRGRLPPPTSISCYPNESIMRVISTLVKVKRSDQRNGLPPDLAAAAGVRHCWKSRWYEARKGPVIVLADDDRALAAIFLTRPSLPRSSWRPPRTGCDKARHTGRPSPAAPDACRPPAPRRPQ